MKSRDEISELLSKIEAVGYSLSVRTRWIAEDVKKLEARPDYETIAEDRLASVESSLRRAADEVANARKAYGAKPVYMQAAE